MKLLYSEIAVPWDGGRPIGCHTNYHRRRRRRHHCLIIVLSLSSAVGRSKRCNKLPHHGHVTASHVTAQNQPMSVRLGKGFCRRRHGRVPSNRSSRRRGSNW